MIKKICQQCHKEFIPKDERSNRPTKYCSRKCRDLARTTRITLVCRQCGKKFERKAYLKDQSTERGPFCGFGCYGKWQSMHRKGKGRKRITVHCHTCGKKLERQPNQVKMNKYHFCNRECWSHWRSSNDWKGKNSPSWRGGFNSYRGHNWDEQREKAHKRDNNTCQRCGMRSSNLPVHHIRPYSLFDDYREANKLDNLLTLCPSCHNVVEAEFWQKHPDLIVKVDRPKTFIKVCALCQQEFEANNWSAKYCYDCHIHTCQYCGKEFYESHRVGIVKYCSYKCKSKAQHTKWPHRCVHCGKKIASCRTRCWDCFMTIDNPRRQYSKKLKADRAAGVQK